MKWAGRPRFIFPRFLQSEGKGEDSLEEVELLILKDYISTHQVPALCIGACVTGTQVSKAGTDSGFGFGCNLNAVLLNQLLTEIWESVTGMNTH